MGFFFYESRSNEGHIESQVIHFDFDEISIKNDLGEAGGPDSRTFWFVTMSALASLLNLFIFSFVYNDDSVPWPSTAFVPS